MENILLAAFLISPFLLLATYFITARTKSFWKIFAAHTIVFLIYMTLIANYSTLLTGHDEYGLGKIGLGIIFIVIHIIVGFLHALYLTRQTKKTS